MDTERVTSESWWSASARLLVFVGGHVTERTESVVLVRAPTSDWDAAFQRALEAGRGLERTYVNSEGEQVIWRLVEIQTLDEIGHELADGREIYFTSQPLSQTDTRPDASDLRPESSTPTQSGV